MRDQPQQPPPSIIDRMAKAAWNKNRERAWPDIGLLPAWEDETEELREDWRAFVGAALEGLRYEDGADEHVAIAIAGVGGVDPVLAIEMHDAWIDAVVGLKE